MSFVLIKRERNGLKLLSTFIHKGHDIYCLIRTMHFHFCFFFGCKYVVIVAIIVDHYVQESRSFEV